MKDVVGDQTETPLMTLLQGGAECLKAALGGEEGLRSVFFFFFVKQRDQLANGQDDKELAMAALQQNCWGCSDS